jgi:hypothetical protein
MRYPCSHCLTASLVEILLALRANANSDLSPVLLVYFVVKRPSPPPNKPDMVAHTFAASSPRVCDASTVSEG